MNSITTNSGVFYHNADRLNVAIERSSRGLHSDADWQSIYMALPFVPPRGLDVMEQDVDDIFRDFPQTSDTPNTRAQQAFNVWRAKHADASLQLFEVN